MTVASLWSVLDEAGCGKAVGAKEMVDHNKTTNQVNPWNYNELSISNSENRTSLAVDLSIWICEALTSTAMSENHADPALHLVYTRTTRLLSMGIKLVIVIEGKRRVRGSPGQQDSFKKRRSGTAFWQACKSCEDMLRILGVPVVRAKAEGEALCGLLNQRGIVDGIISNDGDCLLFGAKVVYTSFSVDNLDKSLVIRYDVSELRGSLQDDEEAGNNGGDQSVISLERGDLISFALLTGSDLAGNGLPKVGHKKAIRFIKQCKLDYPLSPSTAAIDELKSWARTASASNGQEVDAKKIHGRCCSLCCHPGDRRSHQKHGCEECGTKPGESCFASSAGDKFRNSLRLKALAMVPTFDPAFVMEAYMNPNDNQVPITLLGETARSLRMTAPRLGDMLMFPYIIKGRSLVASKEYVKQSLARLLARTELFNTTKPSKTNGSRKNSLSRERPIPIEITRKLVHNKTSCYEISWSVNATATDGNGIEIDGYQFSTIEAQGLVEKQHPDLVQSFLEREKEKAKQGDAEVKRRRDFVYKLLDGSDGLKADGIGVKPGRKKGRRDTKKRSDFFGRERAIRPQNVLASIQVSEATGGDDVHKLMSTVNDSFNAKTEEEFDYSSIEEEEESLISELDVKEMEKERNAQPDRHSNVGQRWEVAGIDGAIASRTVRLQDAQSIPSVRPRKYLTATDDASFTQQENTALQIYLTVTEDAFIPREQSTPNDHRWKRKLFEDSSEHSGVFKRLRWSVFDDVTASQEYSLRRDLTVETPLAEMQITPVLTPGCYHSMVCDMGIQVEITPLVSTKYV